MMSGTRSAMGFGSRHAFLFRLGCAVVLLGLVVGVPLVLRIETPMPPWTEFWQAATHPSTWLRKANGPFDELAIVKLLVVLAWCVWAWLIICVVLELATARRGGAILRMPVGRRAQRVVASLIGTSLALVPAARQGQTLRLNVAAIASVAPAGSTVDGPYGHNAKASFISTAYRTAPAVSAPGTSEGREVSSARGQLQDQSGFAGAVMYVVQSGDTLWGIAQRELGSPYEWRAIAALNTGREQPDGRSLTNDHWIYPGWVLLLPSGVTDQDEADLSLPLAMQAPKSSQASSVGSSLSLAPTSAERPPRSELERLPETSHADATVADRRAHSPGRPQLPLAPVGYGLLGAGLIAVLDRMRRAQQRHRATGLRIALPDADLAALEGRVRRTTDASAMEWVEFGTKAIVTLARRSGLTVPGVVGIRIADESIEFMFGNGSSGEAPCDPFEIGSKGRSWVLRRVPTVLNQFKGDPDIVGIDAPLPSLVTLGRDETGVVLVDLEWVGSMAVTGPENSALIRSIAIELSTLPWTEQVEVILVGFDSNVDGLERVTQAQTAESVLPKLKRRVGERKRLLELANERSNSVSRWTHGGDAWDLCVVLCSPDIAANEPDVIESLIEVAESGAYGVAIICGGEARGARWSLHVSGGPITLEALGTSECLWPQGVSADIARGIGNLVGIARELEGVAPEASPYDALTIPIPDGAPVTSGSAVHGLPPRSTKTVANHPIKTVEVEVRILGPVEIDGADRPFARAWALELVVYLALHPRGASNDAWAAALWPERLMAPASLHSTASAARRSLGTSRTGEDHLPRAHGRLVLGDGVGSDWARFVELAQSEELEAWRGALLLVRGRPFDGLRAADWTMLEGVVATIEAVVVDVATRFAEASMQRGLPADAEWAARQGLRVSTYDERLYRILLRCADLAGNPAGVEAVMSELVQLVADGVEPFDAVHPETLALYRQLSRRSAASRHS